MIVDTSSIVAILKSEEDWRLQAEQLEAAPRVSISTGTYLECAIVIDGNSSALLSRALDELIEQCNIQIVPFTLAQAKVARQAYRDFGKGSGHPAQLNFGDCFAYALAHELREPLLYKGNDFNRTDLRSALR